MTNAYRESTVSHIDIEPLTLEEDYCARIARQRKASAEVIKKCSPRHFAVRAFNFLTVCLFLSFCIGCMELLRPGVHLDQTLLSDFWKAPRLLVNAVLLASAMGVALLVRWRWEYTHEEELAMLGQEELQWHRRFLETMTLADDFNRRLAEQKARVQKGGRNARVELRTVLKLADERILIAERIRTIWFRVKHQLPEPAPTSNPHVATDDGEDGSHPDAQPEQRTSQK